MQHIQGGDRNQTLLLPVAVDDYVGRENLVRFIEAFVDQCDLQQAGFRRVQPNDIGRPGYDPADLLKLYIYGYVNRVRSSRRLEAETTRNLEVICVVDDPRCPVAAAPQCLGQKPLCRLGVAPVGEVEVERRTVFVDCAVEVLPVPLDSHIGLINPPGERQPAAVPSRTLLELRRVALRPAVHRRVVDGDAALAHHLLELAIADAVAAVPTNRPENDLAGEVPPPEHGHQLLLPAYLPAVPCRAQAVFATVPEGKKRYCYGLSHWLRRH